MTTSKEVKRQKRIEEREDKRRERKEAKAWDKTIAWLKSKGAILDETNFSTYQTPKP